MSDFPTPDDLDTLDQLLLSERSSEADPSGQADATLRSLARTGDTLATFSGDEDGLNVEAL